MSKLKDFATSYARAWSSSDPRRVAEHYSDDGSLCVNNAEPLLGRAAIAEFAQGFMSAFPDMVVQLDGLDAEDKDPVFRWTLVGANSGPGRTGNRVRISGFEQWRFDDDGLIAESHGNFDAAEYERQIEHGSEPPPPVARIWHGWTTLQNADAYEELLRTEILPGIADKGVAGYRGARLLRRVASDEEVEFVTILWFQSMQSVRDFAGDDHEVACVPAAARRLLTRFDGRSQHYELRQRVDY
ncbi:MAG TPA: DUF1348 family protein [Acidobacteriota bacterium]|nr:DUF1348 family protein [Acidobacteriota bacterium]